MFITYLKITWRNIVKDRQFSLLNIFGLSVGLASAFLIYLWIKDELSVDKFNSNDSRLYQVMKTSLTRDGAVVTFPYTQGLLAQTLSKELPEVEAATTVRPGYESGILSTSEKSVKASSWFVQKNFLDIFSYMLLEGTKENFGSEKYGVLLSDEVALKLFNSTKNITGKTISWEEERLPAHMLYPAFLDHCQKTLPTKLTCCSIMICMLQKKQTISNFGAVTGSILTCC